MSSGILKSLGFGDLDVSGYCVRCRSRVKMKKIEEVVMSNKKKAYKGVCSECGATIYRIRPESREGMW